MSEPKITTIFLMWDVRYLESGEEKIRIQQDYMLDVFTHNTSINIKTERPALIAGPPSETR